MNIGYAPWRNIARGTTTLAQLLEPILMEHPTSLLLKQGVNHSPARLVGPNLICSRRHQGAKDGSHHARAVVKAKPPMPVSCGQGKRLGLLVRARPSYLRLVVGMLLGRGIEAGENSTVNRDGTAVDE
jgi:hypothetical protein